MVQVDFNAREIAIKIVYYGPALSGKTTNIKALHESIGDANRGRLMTLDTRDDRTLFFDLLPVRFQVGAGLSIRLRLYTVPGQVMHNTTRKVLLQGADGVVFVADSRVAETATNNDSFANLHQNLRDNGMDPEEMPTVIQFNKRDLPEVRSDAEIDRLARKGREPVFKASAIRGEGVVETFVGAAAATWRSLDRKYDFAGKFSVRPEEFLTELRRHFGR